MALNPPPDQHIPPKSVISRREFLRYSVRIGFSASVLGTLLVACSGQTGKDIDPTTTATLTATPPFVPTPRPAATPNTTVQPTSTTANKGGTVVLMSHQEVSGLSPDDTGPSVQWTMISNIHNALIELDENYVLNPILAETYEIAPDGLAYTFKLRKGVKFHDGTEFTSKDAKYTFDFYRDAKNASVIVNSFKGVDVIQTPDPYTLVIKLLAPIADFLTQAMATFIVPMHYHSRVGQEKYRTAPIGTGAFKLKEWRAAEVTVLEAFDEHFRGRPKIDILRQEVVPEASVRAIALETGKADSSVWPLLVEDNLRFAGNPNFKTYRTTSLAVNHIPLNNQIPQLSDKRVRQAMMYAIDRQQIIDDLFKGAAVVAHTYLSPALQFWHNPNTKLYMYDPERAKALLNEAGWMPGADGIREKNGTRLMFSCTVISGDQARRPEAEIIQQFLKLVGIDMQIVEAPVTAILEGMSKGTMHAALFNWTYGGGNGEPDASTTLRSDGSDNFSQFQNARVDELLDIGLVEIDPQKRQAIYAEIQGIVAEEVPFLHIMYWDWFNIVNNRIEGLPETALSGPEIYRKIYQWSVKAL